MGAQGPDMHYRQSDVCLCSGGVGPPSCRTGRLSAAGCGSQLSGGAQGKGQGRPGERRASGRQGLEPGLAHSK